MIVFYFCIGLSDNRRTRWPPARLPRVPRTRVMTDEPHSQTTCRPDPGSLRAGSGGRPAAGLYDPQHEHDACGVGFVVDMKGRATHAIVHQALTVLKNLQHRGACGCEVNTGDGAGILIQMPDRFLRKVAPAPLPPAGEYGVGLIFLPREAGDRARVQQLFADIIAEEGQRLIGWRDVPTDNSPIGPSAVAVEPVFKQVFVGKGGNPGVPEVRTAQSSGCARRVRAEAVRHQEAARAGGRSPSGAGALEAAVLPGQPLVQYADLQGNAHREPDRNDVSRSDRSRHAVGAGARASAVQHQHVPLVAARAPVPHRRAQRRDQHPDRQHQLDAGAGGAPEIGGARRGSRQGPAGHPRGRERHGDVRQRARVPGDDRPVAAARPADDDPGAVGEQRGDVARAQGVLRVPLVADGAVGRPGVDRLLRWHGDRRGARPQRPPTLALLRHQGRSRRDGLRGRSARHPARGYRAQGAAAPGPHLPGRYRARPHHLGRGGQTGAGAGASVPRMAVAPDRHRGPRSADLPAASQPRNGHETPAAVRLHARGPAVAPRADGAAGRRAARFDGHRHVARGALGPAAPALRLLQAVVRAGDQPTARRHPRRAGDVDGIDDRAGRQPARSAAGIVPPDQDQVSDHRQRSAREAAVRVRPGIPDDSHPDAVRRPRRGRQPRARDGQPQPARERRGRRRLHDPDPVGPRRGSRARADSEPAGHFRRPPSPGAPGRPHPLRARRRNGRRP